MRSRCAEFFTHRGPPLVGDGWRGRRSASETTPLDRARRRCRGQRRLTAGERRRAVDKQETEEVGVQPLLCECSPWRCSCTPISPPSSRWRGCGSWGRVRGPEGPRWAAEGWVRRRSRSEGNGGRDVVGIGRLSLQNGVEGRGGCALAVGGRAGKRARETRLEGCRGVSRGTVRGDDECGRGERSGRV